MNKKSKKSRRINRMLKAQHDHALKEMRAAKLAADEHAVKLGVARERARRSEAKLDQLVDSIILIGVNKRYRTFDYAMEYAISGGEVRHNLDTILSDGFAGYMAKRLQRELIKTFGRQAG